MSAPDRDAGDPASLLDIAIARGTRQRRATARGTPDGPATGDAPDAPSPSGWRAVQPDTSDPGQYQPAPPAGTARARPYRSLRHYWQRLSGGGLPRVDAIDDDVIAAQWPNAILFQIPSDGALDIARVFQGAQRERGRFQHPIAHDSGAEGAAWLIDAARAAARRRSPAETSGTFTAGATARRYTATAVLFRAIDAADTLYVLLAVQEA